MKASYKTVLRVSALFAMTSFAVPSWVQAAALDDYIKKIDPAYSWKLEKVVEASQSQTFILKLVSQRWRSEQEVSQPLWRHWLIIVRPKQVLSSKALLFVGNGTSLDPTPVDADPKWIQLAQQTHSVVAELKNVPNQPLIYFHNGEERLEDNSIAFSWNQAMLTGDPTWSIRFPMVKSVVRAMDTIDSFLKTPQGGRTSIQGYVVAGASKRGWTTWLTGAVDPRVVAVIPMVIDVLNVEAFLKHHFRAYGFWAPTLKDYVRQGIPEKLSTPAFSKLMRNEDPYFFRDRLKIPKYIINATGDQFFLPDSSQFYFGSLVGPKYLRYLPNSDHSMNGSDAFEGLQAFYTSIVQDLSRPEISWKKQPDGSLVVHTSSKPKQVVLWSATNPNARDFRIDSIGKAFTSMPLEDQGGGSYIVRMKAPTQGYLAYFVEASFEVKGSSVPFRVTTEVQVLPERLPYEFPKSSRP